MNIALGIEYKGTNYCGWQRQSHSPSVQACLEKALSEIANHPVEVYCAGRTDTGVHATGQVVNFQLSNSRPEKAWTMGANTILPDDICVRWAKALPQEFHARHSATARRYRYVILNRSVRSANLNGLVTWVRSRLDEELMHQSAQALLGENDFSSFQASSCQSTTPFRFVEKVHVFRWLEFVIVDITANAFLHHMVRNIVGSLIEVGTGRQSVNYMEDVLAMKDRTKAAMTAKPDGLYLVSVTYPEEYALPAIDIGPLTIPAIPGE
ncbi:tRNA pseudouridine(38-40) synthase TruA [Aliikangiella sp. G2MR2-5]|uniref:tRNA pseudouridine(38-40) synthase TruA n=1 Tax=Aliikangiella sp. G2MR2-5 TaxID=2788943 RepID=UPI0018AA3D36|nr:tRNA pseudouridine(38-40) synthase TruA [Aliikangiella sp. G2MR2-5]